MLRAALLDVGGTLWPDRLTASVSDAACLEQLDRLLPGIDAATALTALRGQLRQADGALVQDTHAVLARALRTLHPNPAEVDIVAVRRALCAPAVPGIRLFPGARELLEGLRAFGLRCVIVSNVQVRGQVEYWRDFADLGIAHLVDGIVTSLDVGFRKPHAAFFEAAIREAGCSPAACVMIGNSEANDIRPAISLEMVAIRVAIEEPPPVASAAHAVATSLAEALGSLSRLVCGSWAERRRRGRTRSQAQSESISPKRQASN
jgi:FMN phosphatase YigB (HAD superfamily)